MWGLSIVSWDFLALLFGVVAVIALYLSATHASRRIAEANERASTADEGAAKANQRASEAAERAASLEKQAAELRLALARLKAPRNLDDTQQASIIAKLTPLGGKPYELATPVKSAVHGVDPKFFV